MDIEVGDVLENKRGETWTVIAIYDTDSGVRKWIVHGMFGEEHFSTELMHRFQISRKVSEVIVPVPSDTPSGAASEGEEPMCTDPIKIIIFTSLLLMAMAFMLIK